jgi:predicted MFS family arabinose efflux permease
MRSVILDLFEGRELQKMMTYMTMAWSIGPIIAPAIGGYLQDYFGWKACFYFLAAYSTSVFVVTLFFLPETSQHFHPFRIGHIITRYCQILFCWEYARGLMINSVLYSMIILFSVVGPFLIQNRLDYTPIEFGRIALLMGLAWFLGSMTNRVIIDIPLAVKVKVCLWLMFAISLIALCIAFFFSLNIYNIVLPIFILLGLGGIIFPNYFTHSIALFPKATGSANALFGAFAFFIAGISSAFGTFLKATTELPLASAFVGMVCLCLIIFYLTPRIKA